MSKHRHETTWTQHTPRKIYLALLGDDSISREHLKIKIEFTTNIK